MEPDHKQLVQILPLLPLRAELGRTEQVTELLVRDGRGVRLTPAARSLLPYIDRALTEFQAGLDVVRNESDVVRGKISVSFQHTFGESTLPLLISAFRSHHPGAVFTLSQGARDSCLAELAAGDSDLALTAPGRRRFQPERQRGNGQPRLGGSAP